jgi:hypothetical protein
MEELPLMIESKSKYGSTSSSSSNCNKTTTTKHPKKNYAIPPELDKIYQEQLDAAKWNDDVRRRLRNMGELRRIFEKRWILEDLTAFLAVLGIVLGLILDQHMFRMMEWTGVYDYDPYKVQHTHSTSFTHTQQTRTHRIRWDDFFDLQSRSIRLPC